VHDPEAEDHVEALGAVGERERVAAHVLHPCPQQLTDRVKALAALQRDPPAGLDPGDVLLVVDRNHARGAAALGQVGVEPVKRADIEYALAGERRGQQRYAVAVVARHAGGVEPVLGVERERVKPQRDPPQHPAGLPGAWQAHLPRSPSRACPARGSGSAGVPGLRDDWRDRRRGHGGGDRLGRLKTPSLAGITSPGPMKARSDRRSATQMQMYIMLSMLTPEGVRTVKNNPQRIREVSKELEQLGVTVKAQWATLGQFDFISVVEAPDTPTMARVSLELGSRGTARYETLTAIPIDEFIASL
jgi:uncharacterized protein with GYD domain